MKRYRTRRVLDRPILRKFFKSVRGRPERFRITIMSRSSCIPRFFKSRIVRVFTGNSWKIFRITRWLSGFKFGEFAKTRKYVQYRTKAARKALKKKEALEKKNKRLIANPDLYRIRLIKTGFAKQRIGSTGNENTISVGGYRKISY